jgi:hypothetical protein
MTKKQKTDNSTNYFYNSIKLICLFSLLGVFICSLITIVYKKQLIKKQSSDAARQIQSYLDQVFGYNLSVNKSLGSLIRKNGDKHDIQFIETIIKDATKTILKDENLSFLSWSGLDWVNQHGQQLVNSHTGIRALPLDVSDRKYNVNCPKNPWQLQFDHPSIGRQSGIPVIPTGMGVTDEHNEYMGTLVVGIDINKLKDKISNIIQKNDIFYIILNIPNQYAFFSSDNIMGDLSSHLIAIENDNFLESPFTIGDINYIHSLSLKSYPFQILTGYNHNKLLKELIGTFIQIAVLWTLCAFSLILLITTKSRKTLLSFNLALYKKTENILNKISNKKQEYSNDQHKIHYLIDKNIEHIELSISQIMLYKKTKEQFTKDLFRALQDFSVQLEWQIDDTILCFEDDSTVNRKITEAKLRTLKNECRKFTESLALNEYDDVSLSSIVTDCKNFL